MIKTLKEYRPYAAGVSADQQMFEIGFTDDEGTMGIVKLRVVDVVRLFAITSQSKKNPLHLVEPGASQA